MRQRRSKVVNTYKDMLNKSCRRCINDHFGVHLHPKDVLYLMDGTDLAKANCIFCRQNRHIVRKLKLSGKLIMLRRKRP